jgi:hypothetical protein
MLCRQGRMITNSHLIEELESSLPLSCEQPKPDPPERPKPPDPWPPEPEPADVPPPDIVPVPKLPDDRTGTDN